MLCTFSSSTVLQKKIWIPGALIFNRVSHRHYMLLHLLIQCPIKSLENVLLSEIRETFAIFDQDGDGRISKDELRIVMRSLGQNPTENDLDIAIKEVDANGK